MAWLMAYKCQEQEACNGEGTMKRKGPKNPSQAYHEEEKPSMEEGAKAREGKGKKNKTAKEEWQEEKKVGRIAAGQVQE